MEGNSNNLEKSLLKEEFSKKIEEEEQKNKILEI